MFHKNYLKFGIKLSYWRRRKKKKILKLAQLHVFNEKGVKKVVAGSIEMNKIEDVIFIEVEELNREKWCKLKKNIFIIIIN